MKNREEEEGEKESKVRIPSKELISCPLSLIYLFYYYIRIRSDTAAKTDLQGLRNVKGLKKRPK